MESEASMSACGWTLKLDGNGWRACETHDVGLLVARLLHLDLCFLCTFLSFDFFFHPDTET